MSISGTVSEPHVVVEKPYFGKTEGADTLIDGSDFVGILAFRQSK